MLGAVQRDQHPPVQAAHPRQPAPRVEIPHDVGEHRIEMVGGSRDTVSGAAGRLAPMAFSAKPRKLGPRPRTVDRPRAGSTPGAEAGVA